jgi:hypothetical protein
MIDRTESRLLWLLLWSVLLSVFVVGSYIQAQSRKIDQLHAETSASMVPPLTSYVKTP